MKENKKSFLKNIFPVKGDSKKEVLRKILLIISSSTFIVCLVILINILLVEPTKNKNLNNEIREVYQESVQVEDKTETFKKLKTINSDIVGWIKVPNTVIDYPVLQSSINDPEFYLYRDYKKNYNKYGSIFINAGGDIDSKNIILHGHNMNDGSEFHSLVDYSNIDFYKSSPVFTIDTEKGPNAWKVISIFKTNTRSDQGKIFEYLQYKFSDTSNFLDFVYQVRERSLIDTPVDLNEDDQLVTLSTCSYEFDDFRTVVVARKVREGEDSSVDINKAVVNNDAVWPECYYKKNGGQQPVLTNFDDALKNGKINWYNKLQQ